MPRPNHLATSGVARFHTRIWASSDRRSQGDDSDSRPARDVPWRSRGRLFVDGYVVLTDAAGEPINGEKHHLAPGQDARLLLCRLIRQRRNSGAPRGFNDRIVYPKIALLSFRAISQWR